ncbi:transducin family protein / WD-40 repeat family protein, partial [Thalictrum thalictroides]
INAAVKSMTSSDAYTLLTVLVTMWKSRSGNGNVLPWICSILLYHSDYVTSQKSSAEMLDSLHELAESKRVAIQPLLQLAGRLQLINTQINKAGQRSTITSSLNDQFDESEDEDVDEVVYGEDEDESLSDSDDNN